MSIKDKTLSKALADFEKLLITKHGEMEKIITDLQLGEEGIQELMQRETNLQGEITDIEGYVAFFKKIISTET